MDGYQKIMNVFPKRIRGALSRFSQRDAVCEIRLRKSAPISLTLFSGNLAVDADGKPCVISRGIAATPEEMEETLAAFCEGSLYRHLPRLEEGFLVGPGGVRMGVVFENGSGSPSHSFGVTALNFRIPRLISGASDAVAAHFRARGVHSLLIVSLPGAGKTTLMRDLAAALSTGRIGEAKRVAVIDERGELFPEGEAPGGFCDLFSGYPKARGIEIATRLLNPEIILCDEIGSSDDVRAILSAQAGGSVFLATAHAASRESVMQKPNLRALIEAGIFETLAVLEREAGEKYRSRLSFCRLP